MTSSPGRPSDADSGSARASDALVVEHVSKSYPGVRALSDVTFAVRAGDIHALLGENGAGKSTLIRILSGVEPADTGSMALLGSSFRPESPLAALQAGVSTLYQEQSLLPDRSVMDNIVVGSEPRRLHVFLDRPAIRAAARSALELVDAGHVPLEVPVGTLSVADRQLVDIARALRRRSRLLIMDEPTAALSAREVDALFSVVTSLPARGVTVVFVTHRMDEIFRIADSVTVLRDGRHVRTNAISAQVTADTLIDDMVGEHTDTALDPRAAAAVSPETVFTARALAGPGFRDVDLEIRAGEVVAITGVTGSGKEHLGMTLFGAVPALRGSVTVDGRPIRLNPRSASRAGVVGVPADRGRDGVIGALSVQRNLALPSLPRLTRLGLVSRRLEGQLAATQRAALSIRTRSLTTPVGQLSGGNQQKISLGKWLDRRPRVLVLMEPTQGIDVKVRYEFYRLLQGLAQQGTAVVVVSSDIPEVLTVADRVVVMRAGEVVGDMRRAEASSEAIVRLSLGVKRTPDTGHALSAVDAAAAEARP